MVAHVVAGIVSADLSRTEADDLAQSMDSVESQRKELGSAHEAAKDVRTELQGAISYMPEDDPDRLLKAAQSPRRQS